MTTKRQRIPMPVLDEEITDEIQLPLPMPVATPARDRSTLTLLAGIEAGLVIPLEGAETVLGRGHGCRVRIEDSALSRRHCRVVRRNDGYYLEDMDSTNGTYLDGERVRKPVRLGDGARIQIGHNTVLKFSLQDELEERATRRLYESAMHDPLTALHNRRYLDEHLQSEFAFAARHGTTLSLLLLDADHFKKINDTRGHAGGDTVLKALAGHLQRSVRAEDIVARFGGEEFAVLARGIDGDGAVALAERIRRSVERGPVPLDDGDVRVTVSLGVATMEPTRPFPSADAMLEAADGALYRAKEGGRNRSERG